VRRAVPTAAVLVAGALAAAGCADQPAPGFSPAPVRLHPPTTAQLQVQSLGQWDALAGRLLEGLQPLLSAQPAASVRVDAGSRSPFVDTMAALLRTRLHRDGRAVVTEGKAGLVVTVDVAGLRFGAGRQAIAGEAERARGGVGGTLPRHEALVTATVVQAGRLAGRAQEIVYLRNEDATLAATPDARLIDLLRNHESARIGGESRRLSDGMADITLGE
jgi:hypothetical protein